MACLSPPQTVGSPVSGLAARVCYSALERPTEALCCSQDALDGLTDSSERWQSIYSASCYRAYVRFRCAVACSPELHHWWDPTIERAHMCTDFCDDLWSHCYASAAGDATAAHMQNGNAFCQFNTGVARSNQTACLGHVEWSESTGTVSASDLNAPRPPPLPPRPPPGPTPGPPPGAFDYEGLAVGGAVLGGCVLVLAIFVWRAYRQRGARGRAARRDAAKARDAAARAAARYGRQPAPAGEAELGPVPSEADQLAPLRASNGPAVVIGVRVDADRQARMAADLEAAVPGTAGGITAGRTRQSSGLIPAMARGGSGSGDGSGSDRSTPRDVAARVSKGVRIADPFLDLLGGDRNGSERRRDRNGGTEGGRSEESDLAAVRAVRAAREQTRAPANGRSKPENGSAASASANGASGEDDDVLAEARKAAMGASMPKPKRERSRGRRERGRRREASGDAAGGDLSGGEAEEGGEGVSSKAHRRRVAEEMGKKREKRKQKKKEEAATHVGGWADVHRSVYEQLASLPSIGPPIFPDAWSAGKVTKGDAKQLKRAYHKAAAKLHPDKVSDLPLSAQALAEELFKALGEAYQKELKRIEAGAMQSL